MRASILIASHNEGDLLWKTVESCRNTCDGLEYEIIVADDASTDGCLNELVKRFPEVPVYGCSSRVGVSPTKDRAAEHAVGDVLVFLDAHCKPEEGAIQQLVADVEENGGDAIITPTIVALDPDSWVNDFAQHGHGYAVDLEKLTWGWIDWGTMRQSGRYWESPCLIGCCLAVSRRVYQKLWGFDREMYIWGVEDTDFGLKAWLMGHAILHDPEPIVGHRFQRGFTSYTVPDEYFVANQLRMARKTFIAERWHEWLDAFRASHQTEQWCQAWQIFCARRGSIEFERAYLLGNRKHDELWYARKFGLEWPNTDGRLWPAHADARGCT